MKRSFPVTLALWLVLILTTWNIVKAWTSYAWRPALMEFSVRMPPNASLVAGAVWFIIGIILVWSILRKKGWSAKFLTAAALGYIIWDWIERLAWQSMRPNAPFVIVLEIACLTIVFYASRSLSREAYERNTEPKKTE
jgi:hypothetical protein